MKKIPRYRALRISCRITMAELARSIGISLQRLHQLEKAEQGYRREDPERLIKALEHAVRQQKEACERALDYCENKRSSIFDLISDAEARA